MKTIELSNRRWVVLLVALFTLLSAAVHTPGEQVAFVSDQADKWNNWDIYLRDLASGATTRLTTNAAIDNHPDLSPDNHWVVFSSTRGSGEFDLWLGDVTNVEATVRQLTFHAYPNGAQTLYPSRHPHFHPDGKTIIFTSKNRPLDSPIKIVSECSSPKIIVPPRFYEGLNVIQLDETGNATNYVELDIRNAWDSASFPDIWVPGTGTYVGHPSFSHGGDKIVFSGSIDGDGKVWEVYTVGYNPATVALVSNSLRRVTFGPVVGPNPIQMSAGAHFTEDDTQILFSSTRTPLGNSQIFRLPATAISTPVTSATQLTSHPANDYVPEALTDGSFLVTSDLGTNGLCWPGPGPKADHDLVIVNTNGDRTVTGNINDEELQLIGDEVSWFCGLKPNLSSCTFQPRIMSGEVLWLESSAWFYAMGYETNTPIPSNLLSGFNYSSEAIPLYALAFANMDAYMHQNAPSTWSQILQTIYALNYFNPPFPGLADELALRNWLAVTENLRQQKFVVPSIMYDVGVGAAVPTQPRLAVTRSGNNLIMSWPTYWVGYNLESAGVVDSPSAWTISTMPWPVMVGGQNMATQAIGTSNLFFRLKH
jgi:Tol biopolymer transport system component